MSNSLSAFNSNAKVVIVDKLNQNELIIKSNNLIEASYRLTTQEQRIILLISSMIKSDDKDFHDYYIDVKMFMDLIGVAGHSKYDELKTITKRLKERVLVIKDLKEETETQLGWVSSFKYFDKKGYVRIRFDPDLKPYLLNLKERFTKYERKYVIQLKSFYSIRIYELLKQYEKLKERYFDLVKLRKILGIKPTEYKLYGHLKDKILKKAEKELPEKTDLKFQFKEKKQGRKVIGIYFFITPKKKDPVEIEDLNFELYLRLQEYFCLPPEQARKALEMKLEEELLENLAYVETQHKRGEIKDDLGTYTWKCIEENLKLQNSLFDIKKTETDIENQKLFKILTTEFFIATAEAVKILKTTDELVIIEALEVVREAQKKGKISSLAGFTVSAIKNSYKADPQKKQKLEQEKRQKQKEFEKRFISDLSQKFKICRNTKAKEILETLSQEEKDLLNQQFDEYFINISEFNARRLKRNSVRTKLPEYMFFASNKILSQEDTDFIQWVNKGNELEEKDQEILSKIQKSGRKLAEKDGEYKFLEV